MRAPDFHPPGFDLCEIKQIVDDFEKIFRGTSNQGDLFLLLCRKRPVQLIRKETRERQNGIERRSKLVRNVGKKAAFQIACLLQLLRALIQFGVKRYDTAIGVVKLASELLETEEQLAVLVPERSEGVVVLFPRPGACNMSEVFVVTGADAFGKRLRNSTTVPCRMTEVIVNVSTRRFAPVRPRPDPRELDEEIGRAPIVIDRHFDLPAAAMRECVAHNLRNRCGDPRLVLSVEAKQFAYAACPLPCVDDVSLDIDSEGDNGTNHPSAPVATSTVASSRLR